MKIKRYNVLSVMVVAFVGIILLPLRNSFAQEHYNVAVLTFEVPEKETPDLGRKVTDLLTAYLSAEPRVRLVERNKIDQILKELGLSLTGIVDESSAVKIGKLTGAQIMVTGRAFTVDEEIIITARIIGVETSRVYAEIEKGSLAGKLSPVVENLAQKVAKNIATNASTMIGSETAPLEDAITKLKAKLKGKKLPTISVAAIETYSNISIPDPASETEMIYILKGSGFEVYDEGKKSLSDWARGYLEDNKIDMPQYTTAEVLIIGEAIGEFATRRDELVSCKGRVEFRAINPKDGKILAIDRKTKTAVDLSAQMASKTAIQEATADIASDFIARLVEEWNK